MPSFPQAGKQWPFVDGLPFVLGYDYSDLDVWMAPEQRQRLFQARPWIGRVRLQESRTGFPDELRLTLALWEDDVEKTIRIWLDGDFVPILRFLPTPIEHEIPIRNIVTWYDLDPLNLPHPLEEITFQNNGGHGEQDAPSLYPRPPKKGRWNQTRRGAGHDWIWRQDDFRQTRLYIAWEFHHMNGCWAGFHDQWYTGAATPLPVPEIAPEEESAVITALEGLGYDFDPDLLFFDYDTV